MDVFTVRSGQSAASLAFHRLEGDSFAIDISTPAVGARKAIYDHSSAAIHGVAAYFFRLSTASLPWTGEIAWVSLEGDLSLEAGCDLLGRVSLRALLFDTAMPEPWSVDATIICDAGSLRDIARDAAVFFRRG